ncbi:hypothetical protein [Mangrovibacterium lignilyticum]|uniref:hypothetical protein n=1 Tax=Mangrovibacterium lignilyticum TaxID=2668052 RepID=UPI0013D41B8B|nr:hypothetical protein [Mangrovibacterium lignilyticum]
MRQFACFPGYLISPHGVCVTNYHQLNFYLNRGEHCKPQAFVARLHDKPVQMVVKSAIPISSLKALIQ